ncbi:hypothetical protein [Gloeothece verrucosa]|uniref:Uncharacterized protein n=1 Tax=Gloeothece verrucosa (strain PCC 7822) TaxID=497965 RepID=E0UKT7_GLOV7|nr:hypothetical protein [Gloeothece verrucosa]ADN17567.1 conserved hypothetical protein [Gloeothece verrucosa PCC 7822]
MLKFKNKLIKRKIRINFKKRWLKFSNWLLLSLGIGLWLNFLATSASAQFFKKAEDFFKTTLTQGSSVGENSYLAISLIFNALRAVYLMYIAISLINIINAIRKDEDWQSVARIPLLVIIAVTLADVLTNFIIGGT